MPEPDLLVGVFTANKQNETFTIVGHGLLNGDTVRFVAVGTLPTPLVEGTWYYVISATPDTFQVSETQGGTPFLINDPGSGANEAWSPAPVADVWVYEQLKGDATLVEVNAYAQRGWQLIATGVTGATVWYIMGKQEPPSA